MNIITNDMALSLFPIPTFEYCAGLVFPEVTRRHAEAINKYTGRGWMMSKYATDDICHLFPAGSRSLMDSRTWRLSLQASTSAPSLSGWRPSKASLPLRVHPVMPSNWALHFNASNRPFICFNVVASRFLRHWYIIHDNALLNHLRQVFVHHLSYILSWNSKEDVSHPTTASSELD